MKLHDYFMHCMQKGMYKNRRWIIRCFTIIPRDNITDEHYIPSFKDGKCYFTDDGGDEHELEGYVFRQQIFHLTKAVTVTPGDFPEFKEEVVTSYGNMVVGSCIYTHALGSKLPFYNAKKSWDLGDLDKQVAEAVKDGILDVATDYKRYIQALDFCSVFTDFVVPTGDKTIFLPNEEVLKLRDELLEEYADRLHEPAIAALVEEKVTALDKQKMQEAQGVGFLISGKMINTVRKKMCYFQGIATDPEDSSRVNFIKSSLKDGWDVKDIPLMANSVVSGSYARGVGTALAGIGAKNTGRYAGNIKIASEDCGTKLGIPITMQANDLKEYVGRYDAITGEVFTPMLGVTYLMRDPSVCQEPDGNLCKKCLGLNATTAGSSVASQLVGFNGETLKQILSSFHARTVTLAQFSLKDRMR